MAVPHQKQPTADVWTVGEADGASTVASGRAAPFSATPCRGEPENDVLLEGRRDPPHRKRYRSSDMGDGCPLAHGVRSRVPSDGQMARALSKRSIPQVQRLRVGGSSASLQDDEKSINDLKQLLLCAGMELESASTCSNEEIRKKEENFMQLLQILKVTSSERDDARDQLRELLNKISQSGLLEHPPSLSYLCPESPPVESTRFHLGIVGDHLPFVHRYQLCSYSSLHPLPELVFTTELPSVSIIDSSNIAVPQQPLLSEQNNSMTMELSIEKAEFDHASAIIDALAVKKPLPEKGKLLQAVMEAGPLLQMLLVAGPLPQWRNPPSLKHFQVGV